MKITRVTDMPIRRYEFSRRVNSSYASGNIGKSGLLRLQLLRTNMVWKLLWYHPGTGSRSLLISDGCSSPDDWCHSTR